jgi:hypothetical protein
MTPRIVRLGGKAFTLDAAGNPGWVQSSELPGGAAEGFYTYTLQGRTTFALGPPPPSGVKNERYTWTPGAPPAAGASRSAAGSSSQRPIASHGWDESVQRVAGQVSASSSPPTPRTAPPERSRAHGAAHASLPARSSSPPQNADSIAASWDASITRVCGGVRELQG